MDPANAVERKALGVAKHGLRIIEALASQLQMPIFQSCWSVHRHHQDFKLELEWIPDQARRPGPEEQLAVNKSNTRYYPGPNLWQARELFDRLNKARRTVVYTRLGKCSKNIKGLLGWCQFAKLPGLSSGLKIDAGNSSIPEKF